MNLPVVWVVSAADLPWHTESVLGPRSDSGLRASTAWAHEWRVYFHRKHKHELVLAGPLKADGSFVVVAGHGWPRRLVARALRAHTGGAQ